MVARPGNPNDGICRLWRAQVTPPTPLVEYLAQHGRAISYRYLKLVGAACAAAVERRYLWHKVGDFTLFLPDLA